MKDSPSSLSAWYPKKPQEDKGTCGAAIPNLASRDYVAGLGGCLLCPSSQHHLFLFSAFLSLFLGGYREAERRQERPRGEVTVRAPIGAVLRQTRDRIKKLSPDTDVLRLVCFEGSRIACACLSCSSHTAHLLASRPLPHLATWN